jgi:1,4-alpha-glucan branching enzyme
MRGELGLCDTDFVTLYLGNLTERKRVEDLIWATARLRQLHPDVKLVVAGDGELRQTLETLARRERLSGTVIFMGRVPDKALPSLYALADVFVLPSREEGLGVVLLEAMASGKPVVASRTSGILSVIDDQRTGLLFEPGNIDDLVAKVRLLVQNRDLRSMLGQTARMEAVGRFAEQAQVQKLLGVYENCLSS